MPVHHERLCNKLGNQYYGTLCGDADESARVRPAGWCTGTSAQASPTKGMPVKLCWSTSFYLAEKVRACYYSSHTRETHSMADPKALAMIGESRRIHGRKNIQDWRCLRAVGRKVGVGSQSAKGLEKCLCKQTKY